MKPHRFVCIIVTCCLGIANCEDNVQGFIGDDVLLPCVYRGGVPLSDNVDVYWRDKDDKNVLDIENGIQSEVLQDQIFRSRVRSFPDQYQKRNFSIILKNLQQSDGGPYDCHIPNVEFKHRVQLNVKGERPKVAATPPPGPAVRNAAVTAGPPLLTLLSPVVLLCSLKQAGEEF